MTSKARATFRTSRASKCLPSFRPWPTIGGVNSLTLDSPIEQGEQSGLCQVCRSGRCVSRRAWGGLGGSHHAGNRIRGANGLECHIVGLDEFVFDKREADHSDICVGRKDAIVIYA
jgi:hypothetical protein